MTGENWQTYSKIYSSGGLSGLSDLVQQKLLRGDRPGVIDISRYVASQGVIDPLIVRHEINSLLVLGDETAAKNLFDSFRASDIFDSNYVAMLELYFARHRQGFRVDDILLDLRERLIDVIGKDLASSSYLSRLMPFSDIVLISNSVGLSLSEAEKQCLLAMKRPLFVYFNVGNPTLCAGRSGFYCPSAAEVVLGSYQHAVGADHRLIFQALHGHEFLGCIMRIEQKWCIEWRDVWRAEFLKMRIDSGVKEASIKKDFGRQAEALEASNLVRCYSDMVWFVHEEDSRTQGLRAGARHNTRKPQGYARARRAYSQTYMRIS